jgi:hypothetical protein
MQRKKLLDMIFVIMFCCGLLFVILPISLILTGWPGGYFGEQRAPQEGSSAGSPVENIPVVTQAIQNRTFAGENISVITRDVQNQTPLGGVDYYINGKFGGTSLKDGSFTFSAASYPSGTVTIRAVKEGYQEKTVQDDFTNNQTLELNLHPFGLIPLQVNGPRNSEIDIVFLPSDTTVNRTTNMKISLNGYPGGQPQFENDVIRFINETFEMYPSNLSGVYPISGNYTDKFNFYYYWDGQTYADAFDGCSGTIPGSYWQNVTFSDLTIILYSDYDGRYGGTISQPAGCTNPLGLGRVYLKIGAGDSYLGMHEIGHGLYGLMDTYCGKSYYTENEPNSNIWSSEARCRAAALANNWTPDNCRQIQDKGNSCLNEFWRWDPNPDIMNGGWSGTFGNASTKRIVNILNRIFP